MRARRTGLALSLGLAMWMVPARAADNLTIQSVQLDPPTVHALGVQMLIADDDNRNAVVSVRYREKGTSGWKDGPISSTATHPRSHRRVPAAVQVLGRMGAPPVPREAEPHRPWVAAVVRVQKPAPTTTAAAGVASVRTQQQASKRSRSRS